MSNVPSRDSAFVNALSALLNEECALHERYLEVLSSEQDAVSGIRSEEVAALTLEREALVRAIQDINDRRIEFLRRFPESEGKKLSELLARHCHPEDLRQLNPLVKKLKLLLERSRRAGREMGQITDFALRMVNGTMSILWSATQNVTRSYTKSGVAKESYQSLKNDTLKRV